jgi:hypothetical protein
MRSSVGGREGGRESRRFAPGVPLGAPTTQGVSQTETGEVLLASFDLLEGISAFTRAKTAETFLELLGARVRNPNTRKPHVHSCTFMPNDPKKDEIPLGIWFDLLEKELKAALDDLAKIRKGKVAERKKKYWHNAQGRSRQCSPLLERVGGQPQRVIVIPPSMGFGLSGRLSPEADLHAARGSVFAHGRQYGICS